MTESSMGALRSVLIVTGSDRTRRMYAEYLGWLGIVAREVGTAADAIRALRSFRPDALVTEDRLPDSTGPDLARVVRRCRATFDLPIVLLSSDTFGGQPPRDHGCDRVVVVPVLPASLHGILQSIVRECTAGGRPFESWLFTRNRESVWIVRTADLELAVAGPSQTRDAFAFDDEREMSAFRADYEERLRSDGFALQSEGDDRRSGRDRRSAERPGMDRRLPQ